MEKVKRDLKEAYEGYLESGLSKGEALSKAIEDIRGKHDRETFLKALEEFLREVVGSFKPENLTEADPLLSLVESAYAEYEILRGKAENLFKKGK
ncbi:MAG: hypothetical protein ABGX12_00340 [Desulfurobacteriaceae bacterium]